MQGSQLGSANRKTCMFNAVVKQKMHLEFFQQKVHPKDRQIALREVCLLEKICFGGEGRCSLCSILSLQLVFLS